MLLISIDLTESDKYNLPNLLSEGIMEDIFCSFVSIRYRYPWRQLILQQYMNEELFFVMRILSDSMKARLF